MGCWVGIVCIVSKPRPARNGFQFLTGAVHVYFSVLQNIQMDTVVYPDYYAIGIGDSYPGFKSAV
jgi:hypothetical protein